MMTFDPRIVRYDNDQTREFYRRLVERARSVPGVKSPTMVGTNLPSRGRHGTYSPKGTSRILS